MKTIRLMKHYVTDGTNKARVWYSRSHKEDGTLYVSIYAKDYGRTLRNIFKDAENNTDSMTDYFETDTVRIYPGQPLYNAALARCA